MRFAISHVLLLAMIVSACLLPSHGEAIRAFRLTTSTAIPQVGCLLVRFIIDAFSARGGGGVTRNYYVFQSSPCLACPSKVTIY